MFHQVDDKHNWESESLSMSTMSFRILIESLIKKGYNFVSLQDIAAMDQMNSKSVALTFDDGYVDLYSFQAPYLFDKNIPFAVFPSMIFINKPLYMTYEQLKTLSENSLCTVGAHSVNHPNLRKLTDECSKSEITHSKEILKGIISKEVEYFAYPYGSLYAVSFRDIKFVKEAGYKLAFSTIKSCLSKNYLKSRWFLPRINVNELNYNKIF
jgi:peptidoglycan/xylan/chitin deacetylase (PgdA/CDA1 family)